MRSQCGKKHSLIPLFHEHRTSCEAWPQLPPFHAFQCAAEFEKKKKKKKEEEEEKGKKTGEQRFWLV